MKVLNRQQVYNEERRIQNEWAKRDFNREKMLEEVYQASVDRIQNQIDDYYLSYASRSGLTRAEANKRIQNFDVPKWAKKAAQAVEEKDFSPYTDEWLRTYNSKMYISRAELLKAELEIELQNMYSKENAIMAKHFTNEALDELKRQAGILEMTIAKSGYAKLVEQVINSSFRVEGFATFSENLWMYQTELKADLDKLLVRSVTMGRNPKQLAPELSKYLTDEGRENTKFNTQRLMVTETTRVQTVIQEQSYRDADINQYVYIAEPTACKVCLPLNGKIFNVDDMQPGVNAPNMHPFCKCSTAPYVDDTAFKKSLKTRGL